MNKRKIQILIAFVLILAIGYPGRLLSFAAEKTPVKLEIQTSAKITDYCKDDVLNTRGLTLLVTYDDESCETISEGFQLSYDFSSTGKQKVEISYTENNTTVKTDYTVNVFENPVIVTRDTSVEAGSYFTYPIEIEGNCGLMGIDLKVVYDATVFTPISVEKGTLVTDGLMDDSIATAEAGSFDIIWSGSSEMTSNGNLCSITFYCKKDTKNKSGDIEISTIRENTYKESYSTISCTGAKTTVSITQKSEDISIRKRTLDNLVLVMTGWKTNEKQSKPVLTGNTGNGQVQYLYAPVGSDKFVATVPCSPGTYVVKAVVEETEQYYSGTATCVFTIFEAEIGNQEQDKPVIEKKNQAISTVSSKYTKYYGTKAFQLKARTNGDGKLTYRSSNKTIIIVDSKGKVVIKGTGKATITINASATKNYKAALKKITITVKPQKATIKSLVSKKKGTIRLNWTKDSKVSGYEISVATNRAFTKNKKTYKIKSNKVTNKTIQKLKSKKTYYVKIRSYKTVGKNKIYGKYSKIKTVRVK